MSIAIKINAIAVVVADGTIDNAVPVALTLGAMKPEAPVGVFADYAIGHAVPVALAGRAIKIDARVTAPADGAIGNGVPVALAPTGGTIKIDAPALVVGNHQVFDPAVVHILTV